jgi:predicted O-methyltransferase YrrM
MDAKVEKTLQKLEETGREFWIIPHETGEFLNNLIREKNIKCVLEVGTSIGYSGIWMAEALSHTGGKLYTLESHNERFAKAKNHFEEAGLTQYVTQLKGHAPDIEIPDMFDLLFLDATKIEYVSYIKTFLFHMKKGGIIIADNAISHRKELAEYEKYIFSSDQLKSELKELGAGIFISTII